MGAIISIREQIGSWEFRVGFCDGEERTVSIDPDKRGLFQVQEQTDKKSLACPFLRNDIPDKRICTVHATRPELCRSYICSRIQILNKNGKKCGRVLTGSRIFETEDRILRDLWNRMLRDVRIEDDEEWERRVGDVFEKEGFRVIR